MPELHLSRAQMLALLGAAPILTSSPAAAALEGPKRGGSLRVILGREIIGMDPQGASSGVDRNVYPMLYNALVTVDQNLRIVPDLARSWTMPNDRTYVFILRPGLRFHDGTPCDAAAVKKNFDYMLDPKNASGRRAELASIASVEAPNPTTVRFELKTPFAPFLAIISDRAGFIVSPTARAKYGKDLTRNPVGTGPFTFVEWMRDDHLRLRRNDNYFEKGLPYLDEVVYKPIVDQTVALTELRTGNVDILYTNALDYKDVRQVRGIKGLTIFEGPGVGYEGFWMNTVAGVFANRNLREAFSLSIDRPSLLAIAYNGVGQNANGPIAPSSWAYERSMPVVKRDLALAKKRLADGGKAGGFRMVCKTENSPFQTKLTQLVQAQVKEIGIDMRIHTEEFASLLKSGEHNDFDALSLGWSGRIDPDGNIEPIFETHGTFNYGKYSVKEVDQLIEHAREVKQTERKAVYDKITHKINDDVAYCFTWFPPALFAATSALKGFSATPDGLMHFKASWLNR